jgi:hypothetical protein
MKRKFVQIHPIKVNRGQSVYIGAMAIADDGTAWNLVFDPINVRDDNDGFRWVPMLSLPDSNP